jgi:hypothetical protein
MNIWQFGSGMFLFTMVFAIAQYVITDKEPHEFGDSVWWALKVYTYIGAACLSVWLMAEGIWGIR